MPVDANDLKKDCLMQWVGRYCHDRRWALTFGLLGEERKAAESECDERDRQLVGVIELEVIEKGRDMGMVLAEFVNGICDSWREDEFSSVRAPLPGPVDESLFATHGDDITDVEFFNLIWKNPAYLGAVFALDKIGIWRREMYSGDRQKATNAKAMLRRIGATLAREKEQEGKGTGYREGVPAWLICKLHGLIWQEFSESGERFQNQGSFGDLKAYVLQAFNIVLDDESEKELVEDPTDVLRPKNLAAYLTGKVLGLKTTGVLSALQNK